ncbi:hypothetical protein [Neisseria chenwenguii]|uniref:hypothetical protein n=1 Tax=Neisseria chenwenguii TaxID=1853278 RepID=UPI000F50546F|nr:hypothetical protein [Neisseria chenwenguii]
MSDSKSSLVRVSLRFVFRNSRIITENVQSGMVVCGGFKQMPSEKYHENSEITTQQDLVGAPVYLPVFVKKRRFGGASAAS